MTPLPALSWPDRLLPVFILVAIALGFVLSIHVPAARTAFSSARFLNVGAPLLVGLVVMMVPPLCKVEWERVYHLARTRSWLLARSRPLRYYARHLAVLLALNWVVCPMLMLGLAWLTMFDMSPEYRTGIIMIGMARCVAMVLVWNHLAGGDPLLCAVLVLLNSALQLVLYAPYMAFMVQVVSGAPIGGSIAHLYTTVAQSVGFFLGVPMALGIAIRLLGLVLVGRETYDKHVVPAVSPLALVGLLYTIVVMFTVDGNDLVHHLGNAVRCFVPLVLYFAITWCGTFVLMRWLLARWARADRAAQGEAANPLLCACEKSPAAPTLLEGSCDADYAATITHTFTAASNNFELSLAVAISLYGAGSKQAIAATFGPLLEIPILVLLTMLATHLRSRLLWGQGSTVM